MDFRYYPFDNQTCSFWITAFKNASYQVVITVQYHAYNFSVSGYLQEIKVTQFEKKEQHSSRGFEWSIARVPNKRIFYWNETFSVTLLPVKLKRNTSPFFTNIYLPTELLTIISFIGFVIPVDLVPGRMALLVTIFLMLVNISSIERNRGPIVGIIPLMSYTNLN